jgi:Ca-activated chloride channel homolog
MTKALKSFLAVDRSYKRCRTASLISRLIALIFILLLSLSTTAQTTDTIDEDIVRTDTNLVVLNVTVIDSSGEFVNGLRRKDFKILENGVEQSINTFSMEETPFTTAILLDTSGSMETRITLARAATVRFLDGLRQEDTAAVYQFNSKVELIQDFSFSKDLADMAYGIRSQGYTVLNDAIIRATTDLSKRTERRRAIVILSDGEDTKSSNSKDKALAAALEIGATIYAVDMSGTESGRPNIRSGAGILKELATKTGGKYIATPGGQGLRDAFASIVQELSNQYTIGYIPSDHKQDGKWRSIEIRIPKPGLKIRTRQGYRTSKKS